MSLKFLITEKLNLIKTHQFPLLSKLCNSNKSLIQLRHPQSEVTSVNSFIIVYWFHNALEYFVLTFQHWLIIQCSGEEGLKRNIVTFCLQHHHSAELLYGIKHWTSKTWLLSHVLPTTYLSLIFYLDCTRWCAFTFLTHISKKSKCCWRENQMICVLISPT